jgi:hypothetical protein
VKQTVGGGGGIYSEYCDVENVKYLQVECAGLEGDAMEACWADFGCDVNEVIRHYSSVVADIKKQHDGHASRGHGRCELSDLVTDVFVGHLRKTLTCS